MKATKIIMKLTMTTAREFSFYMESEKHFEDVNKQLCAVDPQGKVQCIPTLAVDPKHVISVEKIYKELEE